MLGYNSFSRDGKDLGMGLFYEIAVFPQNSTATISAATGDERWVPLYRLPAAVGDAIEVAVPWFMIGLRPGDLTYITVAIYVNGSLAETATRLGGVYQVLVPRVMGAVAGEKVIADIRDPEGDDNGAGTYVYPKNPVFVPGVFDIIRFRVVDAGESIRFETYVKELGGNPWGGPNGFSLQYIHIYIRTTSTALPFNKTTFGLNVVLDNDSAWQIAILVAPGWGTDPVPEGEKAALYYSNGTVVVQDDLLKVYVDTSTNAIIAEVKKPALIDVDNIDKWVVTVALTSYDGYGPQKIRPFTVDAQEWVVGVGKEHALAVASNVVPRIMDLLAPTKEEQYRMLTSYKVDIVKGVAEPAVIHGIKLGAVQAPQTIVTVTTTVYSTNTVTTTTTQTVLITTTLPQATTTTLVMTVTEVRTDWVTVSIIAIVTLLIGIAVGYLIKRRK
jgi:carbohydrate-binding DOMON domain-containing protein